MHFIKENKVLWQRGRIDKKTDNNFRRYEQRTANNNMHIEVEYKNSLR